MVIKKETSDGASKAANGSASSSSSSSKKSRPTIKQTCPSHSLGHLPPPSLGAKYRSLSAAHVNSFDYFLHPGLGKAVADIPRFEIDVVGRAEAESSAAELPDRVDAVRLWIENVRVSPPVRPGGDGGGRSSARPLTPRQCRESRRTYAGPATCDLCHQMVAYVRNDEGVYAEESVGRVRRSPRRLGELPVMVGSRRCRLRGKTAKELVALREEANEFGGYFVVNGIERCVRMLQVPRRDHPTAIERSSYAKRGPQYTPYGVAIRCARRCGDQTTRTNTLHYLTTGGANLKMNVRKQEFVVPAVIVLRALSGRGETDEELSNRIVSSRSDDTFARARARLLLREGTHRYRLHTQRQALAFLGERFRTVFGCLSRTASNEAVGRHLIDRHVMIHLDNDADKLECLLLCLRKLYAFVSGSCRADNTDSLSNHELLTPGHLMLAFVKEKLEECLENAKKGLVREMSRDLRRVRALLKSDGDRYVAATVDRFGRLGDVGAKVSYLLSTGNVVSTTGLDLMQASGFTVVAERLNFWRFCAHFRAVHRGAFFAEMRTTAVRKLLPDQWGFLCPVHTPDGGPCGLLSHLALRCQVQCAPIDPRRTVEVLVELGVEHDPTSARASAAPDFLPVCLDGRVIGGAPPRLCREIADELRRRKVEDDADVPISLEIAHVPVVEGGPYPGLFLFTGPARMIRPVLHLPTSKVTSVGPMEQPYLDVACLPSDVQPGVTSHLELDPTNTLSLVSSLTPFSDYNQSPRNMYQCQMAKQTMGTPCHSFPHRTDNKLYRLHTPQAPLVQTERHAEYEMDQHPNGTNAVVAVLSYTGFDMEDAMILNKSSLERGLAHASVYKTVVVDVQDEAKMLVDARSDPGGDRGSKGRVRFGNRAPAHLEDAARRRERKDDDDDDDDRRPESLEPDLGPDGLPEVGTWLREGDPLYCVVDHLTGRHRVGRHKEHESACVQRVTITGSDGPSDGPPAARRRAAASADDAARRSLDRVSVSLRVPRNPVIGDKFSSRHGQKGVLSILWPQTDMPFSESGISPDIIINPHAFPSRMTIGMLIESMAGKSGALHGMYQDATPFSFHESGSKLAVDHVGEQLQAAGYNYYGSEPLYSGVSGRLLQADLYVGVVYYQRLRHMVSDKSQVRSTGPVNQLTRQPVKGRKRGGGVRLGEMERDSLLSHGAAFCLHDRLMNCSDRHVAYACARCGDLLSPTTERSQIGSVGQSAAELTNAARLRVFCRNEQCRDAADAAATEGSHDESVEPIELPYVYRYLTNELAGMNIKMTMELE